MFKPIKILEANTIDYHGLSLIVPKGTKYVATDVNGMTFAYTRKPKAQLDFWLSMGNSESVCNLKFEGDWRESLVKI